MPDVDPPNPGSVLPADDPEVDDICGGAKVDFWPGLFPDNGGINWLEVPGRAGGPGDLLMESLLRMGGNNDWPFPDLELVVCENDVCGGNPVLEFEFDPGPVANAPPPFPVPLPDEAIFLASSWGGRPGG